MSLLDKILETKRDDVERAKSARPLSEIQRRIRDIEKPRSFAKAIESDRFGIIAEIKKKSPSRAAMYASNVEAAPDAYRDSPLVKAVSVLTDWTYFGMTIEEMELYKSRIGKPVLRKDFIFHEYQVWEARAFGADAILLMASLPKTTKNQLKGIFDLATELGMDVLFEVHSEPELRRIPAKAKIVGINSRKLMSSQRSLRYWLSRVASKFVRDLSTDMDLFEELIDKLPKGVLRIAESGVSPNQISKIRDLGFNCALIGTSLLQSSLGVRETLKQFEDALRESSSVVSIPKIAPARV